MATILTQDIVDDVFGDGELDEALLQAVWQELEGEARRSTDQEVLFEERIAFVCTMMKVPSLYPEQVQVLRALEEGRDVCLLARTGFGKSLVFQALYWMHVKTLMQKPDRTRTGIARPKKSITIVFVPLSGLGEEQVEKLNRDEGKEVAFFYDRSKIEPQHVHDIAAGKYRIIYMSPEKALSQSSSDHLWSQPEFRAQVNLVAIDEVHLVHDWGVQFREAYAKLGAIRDRFKTSVPWLLCSATLPKSAKIEVLRSLKIDDHEEIVTDLNRANCYYNIMQGSGVDYTSGPSSLDFLLDDLTFDACTPEVIPKTLIYFEEIPVLLAFQARLRELLPVHLQVQRQTIVESYYSTRTTDKKTWVRAEFLLGTVCRIICTTEAFGMGMDIPDIVRVFQWGLTKSVCSLIQRFGRAARNPKLTAICTLVVSREYFNITSEDDFQNTNDTQRKMEQNKPDLYKILRARCFRQGFLDYLGVSNQYVEPAPGKCCSRCSKRELLNDVVIGTKGLCDPVKDAIRQEQVAVKTSQKTPALIIEPVLEELRIWRRLVTRVMWGGDKPHALFLPEGYIPDSVLEQLAKNVASIVAPKEGKDCKTAGQISTWDGMKRWEVREPQLKDFLIRGWEKGMRLVEEENRKKKEARKKKRIMQQLRNRLNHDSKLPVKGTANQTGPSRLGSVSRRGSNASIESRESISSVDSDSNVVAASATSAATMAAGISLQGMFKL